jgi:hypothetical protein
MPALFLLMSLLLFLFLLLF